MAAFTARQAEAVAEVLAQALSKALNGAPRGAGLPDGGAAVEELLASLRNAMDRRNAPLQARIAELEARKPMVFAGPHSPAEKYLPGACVQRGGALFVCLVPTAETPGQSSHWRQLAVCK